MVLHYSLPREPALIPLDILVGFCILISYIRSILISLQAYTCGSIIALLITLTHSSLADLGLSGYDGNLFNESASSIRSNFSVRISLLP